MKVHSNLTPITQQGRNKQKIPDWAIWLSLSRNPGSLPLITTRLLSIRPARSFHVSHRTADFVLLQNKLLMKSTLETFFDRSIKRRAFHSGELRGFRRKAEKVSPSPHLPGQSVAMYWGKQMKASSCPPNCLKRNSIKNFRNEVELSIGFRKHYYRTVSFRYGTEEALRIGKILCWEGEGGRWGY